MNVASITEAIAAALRKHEDVADASVIDDRTVGVETAEGAQYFVTVADI